MSLVASKASAMWQNDFVLSFWEGSHSSKGMASELSTKESMHCCLINDLTTPETN